MTIQKPLDNQFQYDLANNPLSEVLDSLIEEAANFPMPGLIEGAIVLDGDGRTIATSGRYLRRNLWEIAALSAALAGVAKQGQVYLQAGAIADIMVLYGDKQFYVCYVGQSQRGFPILLAIVADIRTNIGFVRIRMQQTAKELITLVENDAEVQRLLELPEEELEGAMRTLTNAFTGSRTE
jgi:predicted regulator of Ras-like GTPase activity (Roadblock/LC7/MglB family)